MYLKEIRDQQRTYSRVGKDGPTFPLLLKVQPRAQWAWDQMGFLPCLLPHIIAHCKPPHCMVLPYLAITSLSFCLAFLPHPTCSLLPLLPPRRNFPLPLSFNHSGMVWCLVIKLCPALCDCQAPLSMGLSQQEDWSVLPFPSPGDVSDPGIKSTSLSWQTDSLLLSHQGSPLSFLVLPYSWLWKYMVYGRREETDLTGKRVYIRKIVKYMMSVSCSKHPQ